ncbi:hypothetical protein Hypma_009775 [Hypsizygus marmoreus]|uniref:Uncharacterized protein n=1 Tax=Hypsizygus marmoreus TaxID=39966 RepID=A0A369JL03_HYPMA|nr:hypothetical protein Hypma_009775 [Hypsizygus marmoreus]
MSVWKLQSVIDGWPALPSSEHFRSTFAKPAISGMVYAPKYIGAVNSQRIFASSGTPGNQFTLQSAPFRRSPPRLPPGHVVDAQPVIYTKHPATFVIQAILHIRCSIFEPRLWLTSYTVRYRTPHNWTSHAGSIAAPNGIMTRATVSNGQQDGAIHIYVDGDQGLLRARSTVALLE